MQESGIDPNRRWRPDFCDRYTLRFSDVVSCIRQPLGDPMRRREFIVGFAGIAQALLSPTTRAAAQTAGKVYKVGSLNGGGIKAAIRVAIEDVILRVLAGSGYSVGRNLVIESRSANNQVERL